VIVALTQLNNAKVHRDGDVLFAFSGGELVKRGWTTLKGPPSKTLTVGGRPARVDWWGGVLVSFPWLLMVYTFTANARRVRLYFPLRAERQDRDALDLIERARAVAAVAKCPWRGRIQFDRGTYMMTATPRMQMRPPSTS